MNPEKITKEFFELLESLNDNEWGTKINDGWTIKGVVAHLVGWEEESVRCLREEWKTKRKPWFFETDDYNQFNRKMVKKYSGFSSKGLLDEWKKQIDKMENEIQLIGEENLKKNRDLFGWVFGEGEDNHYLLHLNQIKKVLKRR